jgi:hypothetical protein
VIKSEKEMGETCGRYGRQRKGKQDFGGETRERDFLEDLDVGGKTILKWIFSKFWGEEG